MTLQQIKYIVCVAKYGSISQAAKILYISQPSLSAAIKKVEEEYGICIFVRSGRGIIITHEGEEFVDNIKYIAEQAEMLDMKYNHTDNDRMLFCISSMHYEFVAKAFLKLMEETHYYYHFGLLECKTLEVMDNVQKGISDIGIICFSKVNFNVVMQELKNRGMEYHSLIERLPYAMLKKDHVLASKEALTWEDLESFPALSFYQGMNSSINFSNELIYSINTNKIIYITDKATMESLLLSSNAYIVGSGILANLPMSQNLISLPILDSAPLNIGWMVRVRTKTSPLDKRFIELMEETIEQYK